MGGTRSLFGLLTVLGASGAGFVLGATATLGCSLGECDRSQRVYEAVADFVTTHIHHEALPQGVQTLCRPAAPGLVAAAAAGAGVSTPAHLVAALAIVDSETG